MASSNLSLTRYQHGDWFGVVRNGTVVLLGPDTPHALIDTVWELLASAPEAHEVLHEVTDAFGVSLSRIPPFGIIDAKDALRVFLRGDLELLVQSESGAEQLTGRDVTTWTERRLAGATSYSLRIGGGSASGMPLNSLPLTEGVVLLSVLEAAPVQPGQPIQPGQPGQPIQPGRDVGPAIHAAAVPLEEPANDRKNRHAVTDKVSDETMIGYTEADLGLTIAPGHLGLGTESAPGDEPASEPVAVGRAGEPASRQEPSASETDTGETSVGETSTEEPAAAPSADGPTAEPAVGLSSEDGAASLALASAGETGQEPVAQDSVPENSSVQNPTVTDVLEESGEPLHTSTTDPLVPTLENTTNYDHLWDKTVMRTIEDAAVRVDDDSDDHDAPVSKTPAALVAPAPMPAAPAAEPQDPLSSVPAPPAPVSAGQRSAGQRSAGQPAAVQLPSDQGTGLIESVPWDADQPAAPDAGSAAPAPSSMPAVPLIGSAPSPGPAPSQPSADPAPQLPGGWPPAPPAGVVDEDSDHDGQTIMKSSLAAGNDDAAKPASEAPEAAVANGPSVLARVCSQGHANPPTYPQCSVCGTALSGDAEQVQRPRLGRMRLSTGELIDLDQSLIIGRQPSVSRVQGGTMPRLVQVESPGGDISRSHVEVRLEGWHVMLCDLKATNGTVLIREGQAPRRLAQNEMAILLDGDIAELGDDISLRFEEIL